MAFMYVPNGIIMEHWTPATRGADFRDDRASWNRWPRIAKTCWSSPD